MSLSNFPHFHSETTTQVCYAGDQLGAASCASARRKLPKAALGYIRGHEVHGEFMECVQRVLTYDQTMWRVLGAGVLPVHCPHYFNQGRNELARRWLKEMPADVEVFVSLDTDHVFTPEQVMHLISLVDPTAGRLVVSGLYFACDLNGEQVRPVLLKRRSDWKLETLWDYPKDQLIEVDVVGMGFCAMHRRVLEAMAEETGPKWFDFDETPNGDFMPEDNAFCYAAQHYLETRIYVHTGIVVGHLKTVCLTDKHMRRKEAAS